MRIIKAILGIVCCYKRKLATIMAFITIILSFSAQAQQYPQFSQRVFNKCAFNPAAVGEDSHPIVWAQHRSQWVGFDDAPITQTIGYKHSLYHNMGFGGYLMNDITGPTSRFGVNLIYAYHFALSKKTKLSFGLSGFLMQYRINGNKVTLTNYADNAIYTEAKDNRWNGDCNFGAYMYHERFFFGLSAINLIGSDYQLFREEKPAANIELERHFFGLAGCRIPLQEYYSLEASFMFGKTMTSVPQYDMNFKLDYKKLVFGGISYRHNDAFVMLAGTRIQNQFLISYAYDIVISPLTNHSSGSHEIYCSFYIGGNKAHKRYKKHIKGRE